MIRKRFKPTHTGAATVISLSELDLRTKSISCEAIAVHRPNLAIVSKLASVFEDTKVLYKHALSGVTNAPKYLTGFIGKGKLERFLSSHQYTDLVDIKVPCLAGQTDSWLAVLTAMEKHVEVISTLNDKVFDPINQYVGAVLNSPERMSSSAHRPYVDPIAAEDIKRGYAACIGNSTVDQMTFGRAFRRNADVFEVETRLSEILKSMEGFNPKWMKDQVDRTNGNLTKLLADIQNPDLSYVPTSASIDYISKTIFIVAEQVSLYATLVHWLEQTTTALDLTEKRVIDSKK